MLRIFALSFLLLSCASEKPLRTPATSTVVEPPKVLSSALEFKNGKTTLSEEARANLNQLALEAQSDGRQIEKIEIWTWADKDFSDQKKRAHPQDIIVANQRAQVIRDFLEDELHAQVKINAINMAKRPERGQPAYIPSNSGSLPKTYKALVMVDYQGD